MGSLRDKLAEKPMLGWGIASVLLIAAAVLVWMRFASKDETAQLTQMVTIRCAETGDTWQVLRGIMEKELYLRPAPVDPNQGLINPKTGKPTGFPIDQWKETVSRINQERAAAGQTSTPAPAPPN
jgi:ABC-type amino acid transport substrate-binding protein